jgi:hypothetical protein
MTQFPHGGEQRPFTLWSTSMTIHLPFLFCAFLASTNPLDPELDVPMPPHSTPCHPILTTSW